MLFPSRLPRRVVVAFALVVALALHLPLVACTISAERARENICEVYGRCIEGFDVEQCKDDDCPVDTSSCTYDAAAAKECYSAFNSPESVECGSEEQFFIPEFPAACETVFTGCGDDDDDDDDDDRSTSATARSGQDRDPAVPNPNGEPPFEGGGGPDAVMLAENVRLTWDGAAWTAAAAGATANVIAPNSTLHQQFDRIDDTSVVFRNVTAWTSLHGRSPISLSSSLQTATGTWNGVGYTIDGLVGGPVFDVSDTLLVTAGDLQFAVPAPAPVPDINAMLGPPNGLATEVSFGAGHCTTRTLFLAAGTSGAMAEIPMDRFEQDGDRRVGPLVQPDVVAALDAAGLFPDQLWIACMNAVWTNDLFPGGRWVPVQAGRMFQIEYSDLL